MRSTALSKFIFAAQKFSASVLQRHRLGGLFVSHGGVIVSADAEGTCCNACFRLTGVIQMSPAVEPKRPGVTIRQSSWVALLSHRQRVLVSTTVALFVFLGGGTLDWLVRREFIPAVSLMLAGAAVALVIGASVLKILSDAHAHYEALVDRLHIIGELNHHIRNALQVIAYHNVRTPGRSEQAIEQVGEAVTRIDSVLRDMLPPGK